MKKKLFILFFILSALSSSITFSQILNSYGIKSGLNSAWQIETFLSKNYPTANKQGFVFGIYADWLKGPWYSINTEVNYSQKGSQIVSTSVYVLNGEVTNTVSDIRLNYLSVLITPDIYMELMGIKFYAFAGPRIDFGLNKYYNVTGTDPMFKSLAAHWDNYRLHNYKNFQYGFTMGVGLQIKNILPLPVGVEVRYNPNYNNIFEDDFSTVKNYSLDFLLTVAL